MKEHGAEPAGHVDRSNASEVPNTTGSNSEWTRDHIPSERARKACPHEPPERLLEVKVPVEIKGET